MADANDIVEEFERAGFGRNQEFAAVRPLRLLHLPNEEVEGFQVGPREAFEALSREGSLAAYEAYSFLIEAARLGITVALEKLVEQARRFRPDVVIWQHVSRFPVDAAFLRYMNAECGNPFVVYHEGDVFGRWIKPLPASVKAFAACADLISLVGLGPLADLFSRHGARRIVLSPHSFDSRRFGQPWQPTRDRRWDVVMIGNRVQSRIPFKRMPGSKERVDLADELFRRLGGRFAVYGCNWGNRPYAQGPLPFDRQVDCVRSSWVTVSWDHFHDVPYYFSDRLPIALAAGVPHVTNRQPGYETFFRDAAGLVHAPGVIGVADAVSALLSRPRRELLDLGEQAKLFAYERLSARRVYADLITVVAEQMRGCNRGQDRCA